VTVYTTAEYHAGTPCPILLGGVAGAVVVLGVELLEWLSIDDPIGAVPVHGFCGIWGTLSLGLLAPSIADGLNRNGTKVT
jgi:ammonia channel protein AmtB